MESTGHCRFRPGILACIVYLTCSTAMGTESFSARDTAALAESRGRCSIETAVLGRLANRESTRLAALRPHRRWGSRLQDGAAKIILRAQRSAGASQRQAA